MPHSDTPPTIDSDTDEERGRTLTRGARKRRRGSAVDSHHSTDADMAATKLPRLDSTRLDPVPDLSPSAVRRRRDSLSQSPARSPVRRQLGLLPSAKPPVRIATGLQPSDDDTARDLFLRFDAVAEAARIPSAFEQRLRASQTIPSSCFGPVASEEDSSDAAFRRASCIIQMASDCAGPVPKDENAWTVVVRKVMSTLLYGYDEDKAIADGYCGWELANIQSQSLQEEYLPQTNSFSCNKKTDLALTLSIRNPDMPQRQARATALGQSLSHMKDAFTATVPVVLGMEVKPASGNEEEARLQIAIFLSASLLYIRNLAVPSARSPPLLGWTVHGHRWTLWIAWIKDDAAGEPEIHVRDVGIEKEMGTRTFRNFFTLLAVLRSVRNLLDEDYWPFLRTVLDHHFSVCDDKHAAGVRASG